MTNKSNKKTNLRIFLKIGNFILMACYSSGCNLRIGAPNYLWLAWLIPLLAIFFFYSIEKRQKLARRLISTQLLARTTIGFSHSRLWLKASLLLFATAALVVAMTLPKYGFTWQEVKCRGVDLVIALDVSLSMQATDDNASGNTSRLVRAKRKIHDLVQMLDGDRISLVAFAGSAFVACPLTVDYGTFLTFVDEMEPEVITAKGTSLGDAIRTSLTAFSAGAGESQAIIFFSDGEQNSGDANQAATEAQKQGIRIYTIGIGSNEGAPIPTTDGHFKRDKNGDLVLSKIDESGLKEIALHTGGTYIHAVTSNSDLETVYRKGIKGSLASRDINGRRRQNWHERYQWLTGLALLLLSAELLIAEKRKNKNA
ncbi:MAG: VWA domain-containing protein [Deltaproteobacteria bacterium]|nr:VWA domain-containing protein [Deltaproteobacteria bacterium]